MCVLCVCLSGGFNQRLDHISWLIDHMAASRLRQKVDGFRTRQDAHSDPQKCENPRRKAIYRGRTIFSCDLWL